MRVFISILVAILSLNLFAARIRWNVVDTAYGFSIRTEGDMSAEYFPHIWALCNMSVLISETTAVLTPDADGIELLSAYGAWKTAVVGERVDASMIESTDGWFKDDLYGISGQNTRKASVAVETGVSNYMKFIVQDEYQCYDYQSNVRTDPPDYFYGWMEYVVYPDGTYKVLASALDIDGDPIIVGIGAIPEPSAGVLLLLGLAGLALRRPQRGFDFKPMITPNVIDA